MTIITAIRKFLRLDKEVISLDYDLINSTGLMIESSKDFMPPYHSGGCWGHTEPPMNFNPPIHLHDLHVGEMANS